MKKTSLFVALAALLSASCTKQPEYKLVWSDEFDDTEINADYWNLEDNARGGGNAELQYFAPKNATLEVHPETGESCLVLNAIREDYYYTAQDGTQGYRPVTSARLNTQDKVTVCYGKVEARICFPYTGNGLWPAFWMLGNDLMTNLGNDDSNDNLQEQGRVVWPKCGEIDICEMGHKNGIEAGTTDRYFNGAAHWGESWNNGKYPNAAGMTTADYPVQGSFHIWTLVWEQDTLAMYLDLDRQLPGYSAAATLDDLAEATPYFALSLRDKEVNGAGHYFCKPQYLLFNLSVGGFFPGMPNPDKYSTTISADLLEPVTALPSDGTPVKMYVDYVRYYQMAQ